MLDMRFLRLSFRCKMFLLVLLLCNTTQTSSQALVIILKGRNAYIQFSSHQELTTMEQSSLNRTEEPNRILVATIHHMLYPITVEVLHQVFSTHGFVEKIVTFQKSAGFQALIQFQSRQSAVLARNSLQGRNIYDGCCQLDI